MSANAAYTAVILGLLALVAIVTCTVLALGARDRRRSATRKTEQEDAERQWAFRLHELARRLGTLDTEDQRTAGRVLLNHAHLLRPEHRQCGCPAPEVKENQIVKPVKP